MSSSTPPDTRSSRKFDAFSKRLAFWLNHLNKNQPQKFPTTRKPMTEPLKSTTSKVPSSENIPPSRTPPNDTQQKRISHKKESIIKLKEVLAKRSSKDVEEEKRSSLKKIKVLKKQQTYTLDELKNVTQDLFNLPLMTLEELASTQKPPNRLLLFVADSQQIEILREFDRFTYLPKKTVELTKNVQERTNTLKQQKLVNDEIRINSLHNRLADEQKRSTLLKNQLDKYRQISDSLREVALRDYKAQIYQLTLEKQELEQLNNELNEELRNMKYLTVYLEQKIGHLTRTLTQTNCEVSELKQTQHVTNAKLQQLKSELLSIKDGKEMLTLLRENEELKKKNKGYERMLSDKNLELIKREKELKEREERLNSYIQEVEDMFKKKETEMFALREYDQRQKEEWEQHNREVAEELLKQQESYKEQVEKSKAEIAAELMTLEKAKMEFEKRTKEQQLNFEKQRQKLIEDTHALQRQQEILKQTKLEIEKQCQILKIQQMQFHNDVARLQKDKDEVLKQKLKLNLSPRKPETYREIPKSFGHSKLQEIIDRFQALSARQEKDVVGSPPKNHYKPVGATVKSNYLRRNYSIQLQNRKFSTPAYQLFEKQLKSEQQRTRVQEEFVMTFQEFSRRRAQSMKEFSVTRTSEHNYEEGQSQSPKGSYSSFNNLIQKILTNDTSLTNIDLTDQQLKDFEIMELFGSLAGNNTVKELILKNTGVNDNHVHQIQMMLEKNKTLQYLDLDGNTIMNWRSIIEAFQTNKTLTKFGFPKFAGKDVRLQIESFLARNKGSVL